jgi:hypothetical protein
MTPMMVLDATDRSPQQLAACVCDRIFTTTAVRKVT